jgi:hypothetical protein
MTACDETPETCTTRDIGRKIQEIHRKMAWLATKQMQIPRKKVRWYHYVERSPFLLCFINRSHSRSSINSSSQSNNKIV